MMEGKKKEAVLKATRKLIESKTPIEEIEISLQELGLEKDEAKKLILEAGKPERPQDETAPHGEPEEKEEGEEKTGKPGIPFWKKLLLNKGASGGKTESKPGKKAPKPGKTFMPKLRKGGRKKIKEIIVESSLDRKDRIALKSPAAGNGKLEPEPKKEPMKTKERPSRQEKGEPGETQAGKNSVSELEALLTQPKAGAQQKQGKPRAENTLDLLEMRLEKGEKLDAALDEIKDGKEPGRSKGPSHTTILIIPNREYSQGVSVLIRKMNESYRKIIYVNLNELYNSLIDHLEREGADVGKFFFVDAITLTSDKQTKKHDNCIFVSSPNSLIELSLAITQALNKENPDAFVFDSLSTLLIYERDATVTKFIHSLIGKIKATGIDAYFTSLEGDSHNESIKDLGMFVDRVNTLTEFELGELGFPGQHVESGVYSGLSALVAPKAGGATSSSNKMIASEMGALKQRLREMQNNKRTQQSLMELKSELRKIGDVSELERHVKALSEKIEKAQKSAPDSRFSAQLSGLSTKMDSLEKKLSEKISSQKPGEEKIGLKKKLESIKELKARVGKMGSLSRLEQQVKEISKKLGRKSEKPVDRRLITQITKLENKIDGLEKKLSKTAAKKNQKGKVGLSKKIEIMNKQKQLEQMMSQLYKAGQARESLEATGKKLEKQLEKKKSLIEKAYKKGLVTKDFYSKEKTKLKKEKTQRENSMEVEALEKKLYALNEAFDSGLITRESYVKGKARIEKLLKK